MASQHADHEPKKHVKPISFKIKYKERTLCIECSPHDEIGLVIKKKIEEMKLPGPKRIRYEGLQLFYKDLWVNPGIPANWIHRYTIDVIFQDQDFLKQKGNFSDVNLSEPHTFFVIDQSPNIERRKKRPTKIGFQGKIRVDCLESISFGDALVKDSRFNANVSHNFTLIDLKTKAEYNNLNTITNEMRGNVFKMKLDNKQILKRNEVTEGIGSRKTDTFEHEVKKRKKVNSDSCQCGDGHSKHQHECPHAENLNPLSSCETISKTGSKWAETSVIEIFRNLEENTGWIISPQEKDKSKRNIFRCHIEKYSSSINVSGSIYLKKKIVNYSKDVGILFYNNNGGSGTFFVIGQMDNLDGNKIYVYIMTNRHVYIDAMKHSKSSEIWGKISLAFETYGDPMLHDISHNDVTLLCSDKHLDYAFLKIACDVNDDVLENIDGLGQCANKIEAHKQDNLQIVGHAGGQIKSWDVGTMLINARFEHKIFAYLNFPSSRPKTEPLNMEFLCDPKTNLCDPTKTFYNCSSFHGASGSPVFNSQGDLVLMHMAGVYFDDKQYKLNHPSYLEFGVQLSSIVDDIQDKVTRNCAGGLDWETLENLFPKLCTEEKMEIP